MTVSIHKYSNTLSKVTSIDLTLANTVGMTISHYASSVKASEVTMPFILESVDGHVPYIEDIKFCTVVRKKVNLAAVGPNQEIITDVGKDKGEYKYVDNVPTRPSDLPPGFKELYK